MIVAVTGGTGFVGANIVRGLALQDHRVLCVSRSGRTREPSLERFFAPIGDRVVHVRADVTNFDSLVEMCLEFKPDYVVHAAAITPTPELELSTPRAVVDVNAAGTLNVLEATRQTHSIRRVLYLSSGAIYGETEEHSLITEDAPVAAKDLYGLTKEMGERLCTYYRMRQQLDVIAVRVGWVYGPMERPMTASRQGMSLVYLLVNLVKVGAEVRLVHLDHLRDWIYAADVANAVVLLLDRSGLNHYVYNLSAGRGYTHRELIEELNRTIPIRYRQTSEREANVPASVTAKRRGPMSIERLEADTGFRLNFGLYEGLRRYVEWVRNEASSEN